jgi:acyl CoA:acetate/3-ketoacid CoA transferase beta subunit
MLPGKVKGIGGAMDLVANPTKTKVVVTMVNQTTIQMLSSMSNMPQGSRRQERKSEDLERCGTQKHFNLLTNRW